jgi:hypothetical protein
MPPFFFVLAIFKHPVHLDIPASSSDVTYPPHGTSASQTGLTLSASTPQKQQLSRALQKEKLS